MIVSVTAAVALMWGCSPQNPGSALENQAPDTRIVVMPIDSIYYVPKDTLVIETIIGSDTTWIDSSYIDTIDNSTHDHYISTGDMFHVQWFGFDPDGVVDSFFVELFTDSILANQETMLVKVDMFWTTNTDSAIAFESSIPDTINGRTKPGRRTIRVAAFDNEGAIDLSPAEHSFHAINYIPEIVRINADFDSGDVVGKAIRFSVVTADLNPSGLEYGLEINGTMVEMPVGQGLNEWSPHGMFQFCDISNSTIVRSLDLTTVQPVDMSYLPTSPDALVSITVKVRDLGKAESEPQTIYAFVRDDFQPDTVQVHAKYAPRTGPVKDFYGDGSIFYSRGSNVSIELTSAAGDYSGVIQGYRYGLAVSGSPDTNWVDWGEGGASLGALGPGDYTVYAQCRDYSGTESVVLASELSLNQANLLDPQLKTLLIVDETRNGNGLPGRASPNDVQVDSFYCLDMLEGLLAAGWDVTSLDVDSGDVSPRAVFDRRIILWHGDDKSAQVLQKNTDLLQEYLSKGGRLILSGWDVLQPFAGEESELTNSTGFVRDYLRLEGGKKNSGKKLAGVDSTAGSGYPMLEYDAAKVAASWDGLDKCWILYPRHRTDIVGTWRDADENPEFHGFGVVHHNFHPGDLWRTITLGFPLFFIKTDQAREFLENAILLINQ